MSKFKVLESTEVIIDNDSSIDIKEDLDNKFNIKIQNINDKILIGIPFVGDSESNLFIPFNDAIKVLQDYYMCRKV